jgi:hypothetical protein
MTCPEKYLVEICCTDVWYQFKTPWKESLFDYEETQKKIPLSMNGGYSPDDAIIILKLVEQRIGCVLSLKFISYDLGSI